MDLRTNRFSIRLSHFGPPPMQSNPSPSIPSFPIIAIAVIGIFGTAFLLVSYYVFVIKCCLSWHRVDDIWTRFSLSRRRRNHGDPNLLLLSSTSPATEVRGLDEAAIRSIPILNFKNRGGNTSRDYGEKGFCECAVCLNEFQEDEKLRFIPQCGHVFHIDCIDIWLQNNANCPLCRTSVSGGGAHLALFDLQERIPVPSPDYASSSAAAVIRSEEDYVVIELSEPSRKLPDPTPPKTTTTKPMFKFQTSMGDEFIGTRRDSDERIQPLRRSFSMDSASDRHLLVAVQEIMHPKREFHHLSGIISPGSETSSSNRARRTFFSFGNGGRDRVSRSAVQPLCLEEAG